MKRLRMLFLLVCLAAITACNGASSESSDGGTSEDTADLSKQEQAELVATSLSSQSGGIEKDIETLTQTAARGRHAAMEKGDALNLNISVQVDFYDADGNLQAAYDEATTDRIVYESLVQGHLENTQGYFTEINVDNRSSFSAADILSRLATIDGEHSNHSDYTRTNPVTDVQVHFELDGALSLIAVTVDLDAADTFPESGVIEGSLSGVYQRTGYGWEHTRRFNFSFVATYLGDNTAEVELGDGTVFIVQLKTGEVKGL